MKKPHNRRTMRAVGSIAVVGLLAGCGSGSAGEDGGNDGGTRAEGEVSGTLEIQYFVGGYGDEWWKAVIADFEEEYPEVTVEEHSGPNVNQEMQTRWVSGNPPDLVYIDGDGSNKTQMVEDGQLMDITEWLADVELPDGSSLADSFIGEPNVYDGKNYTVPLFFDTWGTWYDQAWFEEEGFEVPEDFSSWMDSMKEIKQEAGIPPLTTTGAFPQYFMHGVLNQAIMAAGGEELLNAVFTGEEGVWKSDDVATAMNRIKKIVDAGYLDPGFAGLSHTQSQSNFLQHENAYIPVGFWLPTEMANDTPEGFDFGFIPTPMNSEGDPMTLVPDLRPLAIAEQAENPEAAKAFIAFAFQEKYAKEFAETAGALFNMQGVELSDDPKVPEYLNQANVVINSGDVVVPQKVNPMALDMRGQIEDALVKFLLGESSVEQFTDQAASIAENYRNGQ